LHSRKTISSRTCACAILTIILNMAYTLTSRFQVGWCRFPQRISPCSNALTQASKDQVFHENVCRDMNLTDDPPGAQSWFEWPNEEEKLRDPPRHKSWRL
jgi:hypothetical protein